MAAIRRSVGHKLGILSIATGLGKTVIAILDVDRELETCNDVRLNRLRKNPRPGGEKRGHPVRVLFLVHSNAIKDAAFHKFSAHFASQFDVSAFLNHTAKSAALSSMDRVVFVFALFQSFDKLNPRDFSHVVVDEIHHVLAPSYRQHVVALLKSCEYCLGMTATLQHRNDPAGSQIKSLFRDVVYFSYTWLEAKETHFPKQVEYLEALPLLSGGKDVPTYESCLREYRTRESLVHFLTMLQRSVTQVSMDDPRTTLTPEYVANMLDHYETARAEAGLPLRARILIFASSVPDAETIAKLISSKGSHKLVAASVSYKTSDASAVLQRFIDGKVNVLVSCNMISEGFDVPGADMAILARLTESEIVYSQQLGRVFRGQQSVCVLDLALNLRRRWQRLKADITDSALKEMILQFFPVSNFWPHMETF